MKATTNYKRINLALIALCVLFTVFYVVQANCMAAQSWKLRDFRVQLSALHDVRNTLVAQEVALSDRENLAILARQAGMVPAEHVVHLVQDRAIAVR